MKLMKSALLLVSLGFFSFTVQARDVRLPKLNKSTALIMVDPQYCFMPGGSLPVTDGDQVVSVLKSYAQKITKAGGWIVASRDWHPQDHVSFKSNGGIWPDHCVQNTDGAKFHADLQDVLKQKNTWVVSKGVKADDDAYSAFQNTGLETQLRAKGVKTVLIGGLATDYCVKSTALDAIKNGFKVYLLNDASKGVEWKAGDIERSVKEMQSAGAKVFEAK